MFLKNRNIISKVKISKVTDNAASIMRLNHFNDCFNTLVNVYVDLLVFTHIAGTSYTGSGRYWC